MAWQDEATIMLRLLIDDMDEPYVYSDARLEQLLGLAARFVVNDADGHFDYNYVVEMTPDVTITPEPTEDVFIDLVVLRAGCLIDLGEARQAAKKAGFSIREFTSTIDTKALADARIKILQIGTCKTYEDALYQLQSGQYTSGHAILSPFRTYYTSDYRLGGRQR